MDYVKVALRSCIPFAGIAIIGSLYGDRKFFWNLLVLPLGVVLPLISWTTIKIIRQMRSGQVIAVKYMFIYVFSLTFLAVVVLFSFVAEGIGSHGGYSGPFTLKLLFAFTIIVIIPSVELALYRYSQIADSEKIKKIKHATILTRVIFVVFISFSLIRICWPPVNLALRQNYRSIATALIDLRFDIDKKDGWGCTPLWYAVHRCDSEIAAILLDRGALLDKRQSIWGLLRSVEVNSIDMLRVLISHGTDVNSTEMGTTPLAYACQFKRTDIVRILLDSGASVNIRNRASDGPLAGKSALEVAYETGDAQLINLLLSKCKK